MSKAAPPTRDAFTRFIDMPTRWADNDVYGHVNNVTYYSYFDTAVNQWLIAQGLLDIHSTDETQPLGLVVANRCEFFASLAFPQLLNIGLRIDHIGTSSVRFVLGVFAAHAPLAAAVGEFTHVYVNRISRQAMPLPEHWRSTFLTLQPSP
jgi:acyl-CoA thioester hydrolase